MYLWSGLTTDESNVSILRHHVQWFFVGMKYVEKNSVLDTKDTPVLGLAGWTTKVLRVAMTGHRTTFSASSSRHNGWEGHEISYGKWRRWHASPWAGVG